MITLIFYLISWQLFSQQDGDTLYQIQTQSCEKLLTKNYWIHWIDLGEHKSIIFLQWTNYLVSNCLALSLDGISDFKVSCCKTYSAYDMQHKWCIKHFWSLTICWITSKHRWSFIVKFIHRRHKQAWPVSTMTQRNPLSHLPDSFIRKLSWPIHGTRDWQKIFLKK